MGWSLLHGEEQVGFDELYEEVNGPGRCQQTMVNSMLVHLVPARLQRDVLDCTCCTVHSKHLMPHIAPKISELKWPSAMTV